MHGYDVYGYDDPLDKAISLTLAIVMWLLVVLMVCAVIAIFSTHYASQQEWAALAERFEGLPELPPEEKVSYVVEDKESGSEYLAVVTEGGSDVQLTYLEPAAPDAQDEGNRQ